MRHRNCPLSIVHCPLFRFAFEPGAVLFVEQGREAVVDHAVVGVQPLRFFSCQHGAYDGARVDGAERERLEGVECANSVSR